MTGNEAFLPPTLPNSFICLSLQIGPLMHAWDWAGPVPEPWGLSVLSYGFYPVAVGVPPSPQHSSIRHTQRRPVSWRWPERAPSVDMSEYNMEEWAWMPQWVRHLNVPSFLVSGEPRGLVSEAWCDSKIGNSNSQPHWRGQGSSSHHRCHQMDTTSWMWHISLPLCSASAIIPSTIFQGILHVILFVF